MDTTGGVGGGGEDRGNVRPGDEALRNEAAESRLRVLFDSPMIGLLYWNSDGAVTDANDAFLALVGYSRNDLVSGRVDWIAMTPAEYRVLDAAALEQQRRFGVCSPYEKEYVRKDGQRVNVLIGGAMVASEDGMGVAFVLDIADRKRRDHERSVAAVQMRTVMDRAPFALWAVDLNGIFTLSEGRGLKDIGLQPGQIVGQSIWDLYAGNEPGLANLRRGLAGEEFSAPSDYLGRFYETVYTPMRDADGKLVGLLGVSMDVTEKKQAETERQNLQAQLLQVQKLESLGLLAGGIAHDFNNLLTAILGGASTALMSLPQEHPARYDIDNVVAAARRAADLTRQMLAYSGKGHFEIKAIDLSVHVRELATLLETTIPKMVQLRLEMGTGLPAIEADVAQVQQVIMNLVINAAEAIGDQQGTVLVTTGAQDIDELYTQSLFTTDGIAPGRYVFLEVHDTGSGMDEATRARIFDPFFTTKFTGRGLGLAAVLGIVRAHRGAIKVYSTPGRGTTFKVFFPAAGVAPAPIELPGLDFRGQGLALVIDDDASVRVATRRMLRFFGFEVIEAVNGREGAAVFAARAAEIAIVILDMTMPEMGGEETFRELRRSRQEVPVLLTSGYNELEATRRFTAKGLAGFLQKPFTPTELAAKLTLAFRAKE